MVVSTVNCRANKTSRSRTSTRIIQRTPYHLQITTEKRNAFLFPSRLTLDEIDDREYTDVAEVCPHVVVDPAKYRFGGSNFAIPFCCGTGEESDMIAEEDLAFGSDGAGEKRRREGRTPEDGGEFSLKGAENAMEES